MREILFRAKAVSSGQWVYGNFIHSKRFEGCGNEFRIHCMETGLESDIEISTLAQFIGVTDKNGDKIFEGDIVKDMDYIMVVGWSSKYVSFSLNCNRMGYSHYFSDVIYPENCEVIGNIHDNPEML